MLLVGMAIGRPPARLEADPGVRGVVMRSADPDFLIAHADVKLILSLPAPAQPSFFEAMVDRVGAFGDEEPSSSAAERTKGAILPRRFR